MTKTPIHYQGSIEPKDFIRLHNLNFNQGSAIKYLTRAGRKIPAGSNALQSSLEDLQKAKDFINFEINFLKNKGL